MVERFTNVLTEAHLNEILSLPEVFSAKEKLSTQSSGSIYFTIPLSLSIKLYLLEHFGLNLSSLDFIPMRWIKGDTRPHIDTGRTTFQRTYLVYITNSQGELLLDGVSYPILQGTGYSFPEGIRHETIGTGQEPRLLLGPMSELGFAVGSSISAPQGSTIYFREVSGNLQYSTDNQATWTSLGNNYPIQITNSSLTPTQVVKVEFLTDITFTSSNGTNKFFWCQSSHIQFGSTSLKADGTKIQFTINGITDYPGLIRNFNSGGSSYSHIYVYNLHVASTNGSSLEAYQGWIAQQNFAYGAANNFIINCSSSGDISILGGGIVGQGSGSQSGGGLTLRGCSSTGSIGDYAGGIAGHASGGSYGSFTCENCWSEGSIGTQAGGIYGTYAGVNGSVGAIALRCYSQGAIGGEGGGIFGAYAGESIGIATAEKCYSRGEVGTNAGGIFGRYTGDNNALGGYGSAVNCYSSGSAPANRGIFGSDKYSGTASQCYAVETNSWSDTFANNALSGTPDSTGYGSTWIRIVANTPYELNSMGYTPYSSSVITSSSQLVQTFSQTIFIGEQSSSAIKTGGNSFTILKKEGGDINSYSTITINSGTGSILTTSSTVAGVYTLTIRSLGSYNITTFTITITERISLSENLCCNMPQNLKGLDYTIRNQILTGTTINNSRSQQRQPISYSDYLLKKMAYASKV